MTRFGAGGQQSPLGARDDVSFAAMRRHASRGPVAPAKRDLALFQQWADVPR